MLLVSAMVLLQNVFKKQYTRRAGASFEGSVVINAVMPVVALVIFGVACLINGFAWNAPTVKFALMFGAGYVFTFIFNIRAIQLGSLALSALFMSYSLAIPAVYGAVFLGETLSAWLVLGLLMLVLSIALVNASAFRDRANRRWFVCAMLSFFGNGFCSSVQKAHQTETPGQYRLEFLLIAMAVAAAFMLARLVIYWKPAYIDIFRRGALAASGAGAMNSASNLITMFIAASVPAVLLYPTISAGGIVLTYVFSRALFRERMNKWQTGGFICGLAAIVLMNVGA